MHQLWQLQMVSNDLISSWLVAQAATDPSWMTALINIETGKLAVLMIFGIGMISAAGYAAAAVIRACSGAPDESDTLNERITALEQRLQQLEQR
jgi:hypothetical protein